MIASWIEKLLLKKQTLKIKKHKVILCLILVKYIQLQKTKTNSIFGVFLSYSHEHQAHFNKRSIPLSLDSKVVFVVPNWYLDNTRWFVFASLDKGNTHFVIRLSGYQCQLYSFMKIHVELLNMTQEKPEHPEQDFTSHFYHNRFKTFFLLRTLRLIDWISLGANAVKIIWNA